MSRRLPQPMWKVKIKRHAIKPRWIVPARSSTVPSPTHDYACEQVIRWAHCDAGVPPMRQCIRESLIHTTATSAGERSVTTIRAADLPTGQLELDLRVAA